MNSAYEQITVWGPRAKEVEKFVVDLRNDKLPDKDHPQYDDKVKETHLLISNRFKTDSSFWKNVYNSIINQLLYK